MAKKIDNEKDLQIVDFRYDEGLRGRTENDISSTITKNSGYSGMPMVAERESSEMKKEKMRIRKLTPKECLKLMGFTPDDYESIVAAGLSDSAIYKCAGDSIVTTCILNLIGTMVVDDETLKKITIDYVEKEILQYERTN